MSEFKRAPTGCVAIYKGKVLSIGWNSYKTSPLQKKYNQYRVFNDTHCYIAASLHAEIACLSPLVGLNLDWGKVELYIYRKCKSREHGLSRPCPACWNLIRDLGINKIYYTGDQSFIYEEIS